MPTKTKAELLGEIESLASRVAETVRQRETLRRENQDLRERGSRFRAMASSALDPMICIDAQGIVVWASRSVEPHLGWSPDELAGQNIRVLLPEPYRSQHDGFLAHHLKTGESRLLGRPRELEAVRKDGSVFPCEITVWRVESPGEQGPLFTGTIRDITSRRQTQAALLQSEEQFRQLAENIGEVFWVADAQDGGMLYVSPAFETIWGRTCESLYSQPRLWLETVWPADRSKAAAALEQRIKKEPIDIVYRISQPGRDVRWIRNRAVPIRDEAGVLVRFAGIAEDITEWIQSEQAQRESEARLQAVMQSTLDPMFTVAADGTIQSASDSVQRVLGWAVDDIVGRNINVIVPEPHHSRHDHYLAEYFRTGETNILGRAREFEAQHKDGSTFPCEITVWRVDLPDRSTPIFTGIVRDITERKKAEETLRESREWFSTTLTSIGDGVIATDIQGLVTFLNPMARQLTGWDDGALQQPITEVFNIVNEHTRRRVDNPVTRVFRDGETVGLANHTVLISKDKSEYYIADCGSPIRNLQGAIVGTVLVFRDVTEIRRAEQQTQQHQEELAHVMRLSTMGEMAAGMAHELNQPLSAIAAFSDGCAEMLKSGTADNEQLIDIANRVSEQAQRAGEIIRRLRQFVRKREPQRIPLQINDAVRDVAGMIDSEANSRGVRLTLDLAEPLPTVMADLIQIEQVILNLARNGFESMQDVESGQRELTLRTTLNHGGAVEVAVIDTGEGLSDDLLDHVFDSFFTTKEHGMGIGLSISRSIVETHGGKLTVTRNPQRGLTFRFDLPVAEEHESDE